MLFTKLPLKDAFIIETEGHEDSRGFFARSFCEKEFEANGIPFRIVQCNTAYNKQKGTLRGMHYQTAPFEEAKLVTCIRGSIHDVIIDLRRNSPSYCKCYSALLNAENHKTLYIPKGFAHGHQTLEDHTMVYYQMSEFYHPECGSGIRWDDPRFQIHWPLPEPILSDKDKSYPDFNP